MSVAQNAGVLFVLATLSISARAQDATGAPEAVSAQSGSAELQKPAEAEPLATIPVDAATEERVDDQSAPVASSRSSLIDEVVVTAQKKSESINDVPISISAFTGEDLKTLGVTDTRDLSKLVPGFVATDSGYNTPVYTLRGVGFNDTTYTATSTVGVYVDEVNLPYSIMTKGANLDLQRVEVLKGPQGILYGRNTTGGAINYIAKKPTDSFEAGISGSYARFNTVDTEGYVSGPLVEGLNGRLAAKIVRSWDGNQYSNTRPDDTLGKQEKQAVRGALDWQATEDLSFRFVGEAWNDESEPRAAQVIFVSEQNATDPIGIFIPRQAVNYPTVSQNKANPRVADWNPDEKWQLHDRFVLGALRSDWRLSDAITFTGLASSMRVTSDKSSIPQSGYDFNNAEQIIDAHINTNALELRLAGDAGDGFDWLLGGNVSRDTGSEYHDELVDAQSALFPDPVTGQSTLGSGVFVQGKPDTNQYAVFFNTGLKFAETFKLSVGGRYTLTDEHYSGCSGETPDSVSAVPGVSISDVFAALSVKNAAQYLLNTGMPGSPVLSISPGQCFSVADNGSVDPYTADLKEDNFSARIALDWKPTDDYLFYGSLGRGYKAGGFPVLTATSQSQLAPVKQEELLAFELGAKTSFLHKQVHTNVAAYYYDYKDKQLLTKALDPIFGPLPVLRNAPKSTVYGVEADAVYAPSFFDGLFLASTVSYTHTEIKEFDSFNSSGDRQDFSGKPFNFAPKLQYTFLVNYIAPLTDQLNLNLGADYYHSASTNSTIEQDPRFSFTSYGLLSAHAGVGSADRRWSLSAFARNLGNKLYPVAVYQNGDAISRITGASRTYGLSVSYDWF